MSDPDHRPICPDCREVITGCAWNGGRCLSCHEWSLSPDPCDPGCDVLCLHQ